MSVMGFFFFVSFFSISILFMLYFLKTSAFFSDERISSVTGLWRLLYRDKMSQGLI